MFLCSALTWGVIVGLRMGVVCVVCVVCVGCVGCVVLKERGAVIVGVEMVLIVTERSNGYG